MTVGPEPILEHGVHGCGGLRNQNELTEEHATAIRCWYRPMENRHGRSRMVSLKELKANGGSLYPALYIWNDNALDYASKGTAQPPMNVEDALRNVTLALQCAREAEASMRRQMEGL